MKFPKKLLFFKRSEKILAPIPELADYYRKDLARLRVIARDTAVSIELLVPVPAQDLAVLPGHTFIDRRDRSRREATGVRGVDGVPGGGCRNGAMLLRIEYIMGKRSPKFMN